MSGCRASVSGVRWAYVDGGAYLDGGGAALVRFFPGGLGRRPSAACFLFEVLVLGRFTTVGGAGEAEPGVVDACPLFSTKGAPGRRLLPSGG